MASTDSAKSVDDWEQVNATTSERITSSEKVPRCGNTTPTETTTSGSFTPQVTYGTEMSSPPAEEHFRTTGFLSPPSKFSTVGHEAEIEEAGSSPDILRALEALTAEGVQIRGCSVNPDRAHLQALQNLVGWTVGGYDTRPTPEGQELKEKDRLDILLNYRQPANPGTPPRVAMYDYLCATLFDVPMRPVGPEVVVPQIQDMQGKVVTPCWVEGNWTRFREGLKRRGHGRAGRGAGERPAPVFSANRYPYQLPSRPGAHEMERQAQHWILWYFHFPEEPLPNPSDDVIDGDVRRELSSVLASKGFSRADYIWYRNPGMSVPEVFHVQVFWIIPASDAE